MTDTTDLVPSDRDGGALHEIVSRRARALVLPWSADALVLTLIGNVIAAGLIGVAWYQTDHTETTGATIGWLNGSVLGLITAGLVNCTWLLRGRRTIGSAVVDIHTRATRLHVRPITADNPADSNGSDSVASDGMRHYHRPTCPLASGKALQEAGSLEIDRRSLEPCGVCHR